jgi:hypothetical protein
MKYAMATTRRTRYVMDLVRAGMNGGVSARESAHIAPVEIRSIWAPTVIGAAVGVSAASLKRLRTSRRGTTLGGLVGAALGLGCGLVWASRGAIGAFARGAVREINITRDERWLQTNPINYA